MSLASAHKYTGGCYCGNVTFEMTSDKALSSLEPRACDCQFCLKHGAAYLSDAQGTLTFKAQSASRFMRYQQGSGIADFLICQNCGVLVGITHGKPGSRVGAVNSRAMERVAELPCPVQISPKEMPSSQRAERWKALWFPNVDVVVISG
ncbi:MAG: hypothetical protein KTR32_36445 [Granulosicoccus sp.]|nr:hypothetical protein [Granulosicoccus sp.]